MLLKIDLITSLKKRENSLGKTGISLSLSMGIYKDVMSRNSQ